jgi:hypothetical protein
LLADRSVPRISSAKFALIEPDLNARCAQRIAQSLRSLSVLRRVAQEYCPASAGHEALNMAVPRGFPVSALSAMHGLLVGGPDSVP